MNINEDSIPEQLKSLSTMQARVIMGLCNLNQPVNKRALCNSLGLSESTFYSWQRNPDFKRAYRDYLNDVLEASQNEIMAALHRAAKKGNVAAIREWLAWVRGILPIQRTEMDLTVDDTTLDQIANSLADKLTSTTAEDGPAVD